jgi:phosphoribosylanthranilate isomerase
VRGERGSAWVPRALERHKPHRDTWKVNAEWSATGLACPETAKAVLGKTGGAKAQRFDSSAFLAEHVRATGASTVQIVSHINAEESARLAALLPATRRVQVIHVEDASALDLIEVYAPHVHAFLLDSGRPGLAVPELGGTGRIHDWSVSASFVRLSPKPVFLAGGLLADNVGDAIRTVRPFGIDVCTGVRTNGRLDAAKLSAFVEAVQVADRSLATA